MSGDDWVVGAAEGAGVGEEFVTAGGVPSHAERVKHKTKSKKKPILVNQPILANPPILVKQKLLMVRVVMRLTSRRE